MRQRISALGLDIGRKRIGVAGCDGTGLLATGITTLHRRSFQQLITDLQQLVRDRQATVLVVGLPYTMQGELGDQAQKVQTLANRLSQMLDLPVEYVDERLTSHEAEQQLWAEGRSFRQDKGLVDRRAATIILQQWLDQRRQSPPPAAPIAPEEHGTINAVEASSEASSLETTTFPNE